MVSRLRGFSYPRASGYGFCAAVQKLLFVFECPRRSRPSMYLAVSSNGVHSFVPIIVVPLYTYSTSVHRYREYAMRFPDAYVHDALCTSTVFHTLVTFNCAASRSGAEPRCEASHAQQQENKASKQSVDTAMPHAPGDLLSFTLELSTPDSTAKRKNPIALSSFIVFGGS